MAVSSRVWQRFWKNFLFPQRYILATVTYNMWDKRYHRLGYCRTCGLSPSSSCDNIELNSKKYIVQTIQAIYRFPQEIDWSPYLWRIPSFIVLIPLPTFATSPVQACLALFQVFVASLFASFSTLPELDRFKTLLLLSLFIENSARR